VTSGAAHRFAGVGLACRRSERLVFAGLDFAVEAGEALLLTGPNGSGKSSLLRLLAGLIKPYMGRLEYDGTPLRDDPARQRDVVVYLGHQDAIKPMLTVAETVRFWAGMRNQAERADAALAAMDLTALGDLAGRFLSSGQRRRTALARVIASGAPIWLLDEPTVGLDAQSIVRLEAVLASHRADGGIVIAATHAPIALPGAATLNLTAYDARFSDEADAA
jgi:heme exporter protein A